MNIGVQEFDTILAATGRKADVAGLGIERVGVKLGAQGKVRYLVFFEKVAAGGIDNNPVVRSVRDVVSV